MSKDWQVLVLLTFVPIILPAHSHIVCSNIEQLWSDKLFKMKVSVKNFSCNCFRLPSKDQLYSTSCRVQSTVDRPLDGFAA